VVCGISKTTSEDGFVTTKDLNPSQGTGDNSEVTRDPNTGFKVGRSANLCTALKLEFRNAKLEAGKSVPTMGTSRGRLY